MRGRVSDIRRGEIWWSDLPEARRSEPGYRRLVLVIQADSFNLGIILLPGRAVGLPRDSVVNVSQLLTLDRSYLTEHAGTLSPRLQHLVDEGSPTGPSVVRAERTERSGGTLD